MRERRAFLASMLLLTVGCANSHASSNSTASTGVPGESGLSTLATISRPISSAYDASQDSGAAGDCALQFIPTYASSTVVVGVATKKSPYARAAGGGGATAVSGDRVTLKVSETLAGKPSDEAEFIFAAVYGTADAREVQIGDNVLVFGRTGTDGVYASESAVVTPGRGLRWLGRCGPGLEEASKRLEQAYAVSFGLDIVGEWVSAAARGERSRFDLPPLRRSWDDLDLKTRNLRPGDGLPVSRLASVGVYGVQVSLDANSGRGTLVLRTADGVSVAVVTPAEIVVAAYVLKPNIAVEVWFQAGASPSDSDRLVGRFDAPATGGVRLSGAVSSLRVDPMVDADFAKLLGIPESDVVAMRASLARPPVAPQT
jgi:hypothetical protein